MSCVDPRGVESRPTDVRHDLGRTHSGADIDERELGAAVEEVDVGVVGIGEVEAEGARTDEMDALGELHRGCQPDWASSYVGPPESSTQYRFAQPTPCQV